MGRCSLIRERFPRLDQTALIRRLGVIRLFAFQFLLNLHVAYSWRLRPLSGRYS